MGRGKQAEVGTTRVSANGYHYTKTETGWRLTHHLEAEKMLGRPLRADERVSFKDPKKKMDFSSRNLVVTEKGSSSLRRRKAQIEARIEELQAELHEIESELR